MLLDAVDPHGAHEDPHGREAVPMLGVRARVQPEEQHAPAHAAPPGRQAVQMRLLRQRVNTQKVPSLQNITNLSFIALSL